MSSDSAQIRMLYAEARQLQKKASVLRLELDQLCQKCKEDISNIVEKKMQAIKQAEQSIIKELNCVREQHIQNQQWESFQKYAQQIRKIHLGGSSAAKLPKFKMQAIKAYIQAIQNAKDRCDALIANFSQQMQVNTTTQRILPSKDLSFHAITAQSERIIDKIRTEPSFEISPIKRKDHPTESHRPEKDITLTHSKPQATFHNANIPDRTSFGDQLPSSRQDLLKPQLKLVSSVFPANRSIVPPEVHQVTPISLRFPQQSAKSAFQIKLSQQEKPKNQTTVRSSAGKLAKARSQANLQGGYQGVLEILQLQKLRFDKIKHGIA